MPNVCSTVLVVEDDDQIRDTIKEALEFEGYTVLTSTNGKDALEVLRGNQSPCLILLDLMMPIMNGWEFLNHRKADDVLMTIPVAVVSAAEMRSIKTAGEVQAIIKKPIDLDSLLAWVKRYCGPPERT